MKYDQTVHDLAAKYVDYMHAPPNGHGQHPTPYGQSHHMLQYMNRTFGKEATIAAVTLEFKHRREINDPDRKIPVEEKP